MKVKKLQSKEPEKPLEAAPKTKRVYTQEEAEKRMAEATAAIQAHARKLGLRGLV